MKKLPGRRKWKRFRTRGGALVLVKKARLIEVGKPALVELGPVLDISMGGLAAQYIASRQRTVDSDALAIAAPPEDIRVEPIPYQIVKDVEVTRMPDGKPIRTRSVKFGKLNDYQSFQLQSFIREHTTEIVVDRRSGRDRRQRVDPRFDDDAYSRKHERRILMERRGA